VEARAPDTPPSNQISLVYATVCYSLAVKPPLEELYVTVYVLGCAHSLAFFDTPGPQCALCKANSAVRLRSPPRLKNCVTSLCLTLPSTKARGVYGASTHASLPSFPRFRLFKTLSSRSIGLSREVQSGRAPPGTHSNSLPRRIFRAWRASKHPLRPSRAASARPCGNFLRYGPSQRAVMRRGGAVFSGISGRRVSRALDSEGSN
jgi:hypothetical protein